MAAAEFALESRPRKCHPLQTSDMRCSTHLRALCTASFYIPRFADAHLALLCVITATISAAVVAVRLSV